MSITHLLLKLPDKQNCVMQNNKKNARFCFILCHTVQKNSAPNQTCHLASNFFNLLRLHAMRKMLRQLRFDDCPPANFTSAKKTPARLAKHLQTFFLLTFQKQKPRKTRGCFAEIYSASSSLLRSKADCRS